MNKVLDNLATTYNDLAQVVRQATPEEIARASEATSSSTPAVWILVSCIVVLAIGVTLVGKRRKKRR